MWIIIKFFVSSLLNPTVQAFQILLATKIQTKSIILSLSGKEFALRDGCNSLFNLSHCMRANEMINSVARFECTAKW